MFRNMTVGKKIALGFASVLAALLVVAILAFTGVSGIVSNAEEVIYGNTLDGEIAQKEVDHLNWVNKVNALLTDDKVTTLDVQMDHTQCAFGKWLYGDSRKNAEERVPGLQEILLQIEKPHEHLHSSAADIKACFRQSDAGLPGLLAERMNDHLNWSNKIRDGLLVNSDSLKVEVDPTRCALGLWLTSPDARQAYQSGSPEFRRSWDQMIENHNTLHASAKLINEEYVQIHPGMTDAIQQALLNHKNWVSMLATAIVDGKSNFGIETDPNKCLLGQFLNSDQCKKWMTDIPEFQETMKDTVVWHNKLHQSAADISKALETNSAEGKEEAKTIFQKNTDAATVHISTNFDKAMKAEQKYVDAQDKCLTQFNSVTLPILQKTLTSLTELKALAVKDMEGMRKANAIYALKTIPNLQQTQEFLHQAREKIKQNIMTQEAMLNAAHATNRNVGVISALGIAMGVFLSIFIALSIIKALSNIVQGLRHGSLNVAAASGEVSSASQSLAQGASEQAAAIEETTGNLEQMTSMIKQSAGNAIEAKTLSTTSAQSARKGTEAMARMSKAIDDIKNSSDETAKIVKTINEIAFQTNLLALNAAVEAARAGEAGKGFAVVAEEVRSLAQRSAEAAQSTSAMIEESVRNAANGVDICRDVETSLQEIADGAIKVNALINEIAAAGDENSEGIGQINTAIVQMDQVTQGSAANAEESAAASEELSAQAEQLDGMVGELQKLIGGMKLSLEELQASQSSVTDQIHENVQARMQKRQPITVGKNRTNKIPNYAADHMQPATKAKPRTPAASTSQAEMTIPLDDAELTRF